MIGFVRCDCSLFDVHSLKEKRSILKSVITRLKQRLNVSVAELDFQDAWQRTAIGIAVVANTRKRAEQELHKAIKMVERDARVEIIRIEFEWL